MLFDLDDDPQELIDLGDAPQHADVRQRMSDALFEWARRHHNRITVTAERVERMSGGEPPGVVIGCWDEADFEKVFGHPFEARKQGMAK